MAKTSDQPTSFILGGNHGSQVAHLINAQAGSPGALGVECRVVLTSSPPKMTEPFVVGSVESFVEIATRLPATFGIDSLWRGQSDASWTLRPAIARVNRTLGHEANRSELFMNQARTRHRNCPATNDLAGWLFLMQHYGLHTRLLDWTQAPLVALYFAVEESADCDAVVFVLDANRLNTRQNHGPGMLLPVHPAASRLIAGAFRSDGPISDVAAILPPEMDYRMQQQRSAFTIHGDHTPLDGHDLSSVFLARIQIPGTQRGAIRRQLYALGIHRAHLFPDLSNLAIYLNEGTGGTGAPPQ